MNHYHAERQRIILTSELFYPAESSTAHILTRVASELSKEFELLVLTGPAAPALGSRLNDKSSCIHEIKVVRTWVPNLNKNNLLARLAQSILLTITLSWKTYRVSRKSDYVFTVTNPVSLILVLAIIRKLRRFKLVLLVHDIFPENAAAAGVIRSNNTLYSIIKKIFDWAYGEVDEVISIGRDMSEVIAKKNPTCEKKITLIENWSDYPLVKYISRSQSMIPQMGLSNYIVIQYAGNIGRVQGILEFINLISPIKNDFVRFVFRGSGAISKKLKESTQGCKFFILEEGYSRSDQSLILGSCDIAMVILAPEMYGLGVPSKTYNILASGKPILYLGPQNSEIYRLVKTHNVGWAFDWSEQFQLKSLINKLSMSHLSEIEARGENARNLAKIAYTEEIQLEKFKNLFRRLQSYQSDCNDDVCISSK